MIPGRALRPGCSMRGIAAASLILLLAACSSATSGAAAGSGSATSSGSATGSSGSGSGSSSSGGSSTGSSSSSSSSGSSGSSSGSSGSSGAPSHWAPAVGESWQWQLSGLPVDTSVNASIFDIDAYDNDASVVAALHASGRHVVCYVDVGTWESYRPDASDFPPAIIGNGVDGWPDEKWLDVRALDAPAGPTGKTLRQLLLARLDTCAAKGFDAVEPDWLDGYANPTGFPITAADQLAFDRFIADAAHQRGLGVALKNDKEQAADLAADFDFGVDEECQHWSECTGPGTAGNPGWTPFLQAGKAVLNAEYTDQTQSCAQPAGLSSILKNRGLDAYRQACPYP